MKTPRPISQRIRLTIIPATTNRRVGITAFALLTAILCTGATSPTSCQPIGPSNGEIVGALVGAGAVIAVAILVPVEINQSHHTLKGCVFAGPNGIQLQTSDSKTYALEGDPSAIKAGDMVKLHGSKVKKTKDTKGDQVFRVEQLKKDYGPCHVAPAPAIGATL